MAISANIFEKCLPAYGTNISRCGSVTVCDVALPTADELDGIFQDDSGDFRINDALYLYNFEIKACQSRTNGLYEFLMAQKVNMTKRITVENLGSGLYEIRPFIQALQKSIINNEFWTVSSGQASGETNWRVDVVSQGSIPSDTRWFHVGDRVFIDGLAGDGTATRTAWRVISAAVVGAVVRLVLAGQNDNSNLAEARLEEPVTGVLVRGVPNVNDYEEFCEQIPGLNTNKLVPFWMETTRSALCVDEHYMKYHKLLRENNSQYKLFGDIESVELNKQAGLDFQKRWVNTFFWNKPLVNQDVNNYTSLEQITSPTVADLALTDEGRCVGRRANAVGVYEQLAECGRVFDLQGGQLNLAELHEELYNIWRVRQANGHPAPGTFDLFTDSRYANKIINAYIKYFNLKADGNARYIIPINTGNFGFQYQTIDLDWPPIKLNIIWHEYFDDLLAANQAANQGASGRRIWILDFTGIYPGVFGSNRVVLSSGDIKDLAKVDSTYMCVMKVNKRTQTLTSLTYTVVVECPASNLVLENFSDEEPEYRGTSGDAGDFTGEYGAS